MPTILPNRVLFVDDDREMRVLFANGARALGVEAVLAESGGRALELAREEHFPIVVTDIGLPGMDGFSLVERMSILDRTTAFVLVTAVPELREGLHSRADGAIATLLNKPVDMSELHDTLARAFALHQRRRTTYEPLSSPSRWSVLLVEDSPGDATLLTEFLEDLPDLDVVHVSRLVDALQLAHDRPFESIITDLNLPDARGFDAVLRLQASAPNAAILVYSGVVDEPLALQILQLGAQDYLIKGTDDPSNVLRSLRFARERKRAEQRLRRLAHFDQLTGLVNRVSFNDSLVQALARAQRRKQVLAVMMIDLDGFKRINDMAGHEAGDHVLQEVGVRLRCQFREYDVVARFGGDEFAVMVSDVESLVALSDMVERTLAALALPIGEDGYLVTGSVGIAVYPQAGLSPAALLRTADWAMYRSKAGGKNRATYYEGPTQIDDDATPGLRDAELS